jgi:hypothetical protein
MLPDGVTRHRGYSIFGVTVGEIMSKNKIFVRTAKAEREGSNLSTDLKRMLALIDGKSRSGDLAKHAPPSLRKKWNELLAELVDRGFLAETPDTHIAKATRSAPGATGSVPKTGAAPANGLDFLSTPAAARVAAERTKQMEQKAVTARAELKAAAAAVKVTSDAEAKAAAEAREKGDQAARARADLKAYFAAEKEKARSEAKQAEQEAAHTRAQRDAAATAAKARSDAEAKANAEAKRKEEEAARARAGLEAAVAAAKVRSDALAKAKAEAEEKDKEAARARAELEAAILAAKAGPGAGAQAAQEAQLQTPVAASGRKHVSSDARPYHWRIKFGRMQASDAQRLHYLEIENDSLKKLLVEAYLEIETLKISLGVKR